MRIKKCVPRRVLPYRWDEFRPGKRRHFVLVVIVMICGRGKRGEGLDGHGEQTIRLGWPRM